MKIRPFLISSLLMLPLALGACDMSNVSKSEAKSQILRGNGAEPGTLDPALADDIHAFNILVDLYEGLLAEGPDGTIIPGVAASWNISEDGRTYTFELRDNARWSNGQSVVAEDFLRAFRRVASPTTASSYAYLFEPIVNFPGALAGEKLPEDIGVSAPAPLTLVVTLSVPASHWLAVMALPIAFPAPPPGADGAISNGAFTLVDYQVGGPIRLRRNEHYWAKEDVQLNDVVYLPIDDATTELNMYRAGELDITFSVPTQLMQMDDSEFRDELRIAPLLGLYYLAFDLTEPPFDNKGLRQALTMAVNREQIAALVGRGEQPAYSIVPPGVAGYENTHFDWQGMTDEQRQRSAIALYRQAGYSEEEPLRIGLTYDAGDIHERVVLAVASMWRDVLGIETTLDKKEWKYLLDTRNRRSEWDVMRFAWFGDFNAATTFLEIFESDSPQNLAKLASPDFDEQMVAASVTTDSAQVAPLLQTAEQTLLDEYPVSPIYFFVSKHLVKPHVAGFQHNVMDRHPSRYLRIVRDDLSKAD